MKTEHFIHKAIVDTDSTLLSGATVMFSFNRRLKVIYYFLNIKKYFIKHRVLFISNLLNLYIDLSFSVSSVNFWKDLITQ